MTSANYKEVLAQLKLRLNEIDAERSELEVRHADLDNEAVNVKATIAKLLPLCGETSSPNDLSGLGITDAVLKIVELNRPARLTAQQIKERLAQYGFELSGYSNPMASIYKILSRLEEAKKIEVERDGFSSFYKAKPKGSIRRITQRLTLPPLPTLGSARSLVPPPRETSVRHLENLLGETKEKK